MDYHTGRHLAKKVVSGQTSVINMNPGSDRGKLVMNEEIELFGCVPVSHRRSCENRVHAVYPSAQLLEHLTVVDSLTAYSGPLPRTIHQNPSACV